MLSIEESEDEILFDIEEVNEGEISPTSDGISTAA